MNNPIIEIKSVLEETAVLNDEKISNLTGINMFLRALSVELRRTHPELLASIEANIEANIVEADESPRKISGKKYALSIARSE